MPVVVPIVEGHGEIEAVGMLVRRIAQAVSPHLALTVNFPIRVKAGSFLGEPDYFGRYVQLAAATAAQESGVVLVLLDCEDDCPGRLGPALLARAQAVRGDVTYIVALAYREYETWFLAAAASLRGCAGLPQDLVPPPDPEAIRGAKEWLSARMSEGYDPIQHQAGLTAQFDLDSAASVPSFRRLRARLAGYFEACLSAQA
jgi:hypothetical protein